MKKLLGFVMILGLVVCMGTSMQAGNFPNPGSAPVMVTSDPCCYHFVGYSAGTTTGDAGGTGGLDTLCRSSFGPNARACLTQEIRTSSIPAYTPGADAWVLPTDYTYFTAPPAWSCSGNTGLIVVDGGSGLFECRDRSIDCRGWILDDSARNGAVVHPGGVFSLSNCDQTHPVACCAP